MSFFVQVNGIEVRCETAAEAMALTECAASAPSTAGGVKAVRGRPNKFTDTVDQKRRIQAQRSLRFLVAVRDAGAEGAGGPKLVKSVGCDGSAGLGTVVQVTRRLLHDGGVSFQSVVEKERKGDKKLWVPKSQIQQGIQILKGLASHD